MDRLRPYWDFNDLDASEQRFRELLSEEGEPGRRAEILTQLARVEGLRGAFDEGERILAQAETLAGESAAARARVDLERGRLRRSSGDAEASLPLFESALALARAAGEAYLAGDAAHMAALAAPDTERFVEWTECGVELAGEADGARYWLGPLYNNLGWHHFDAGELEPALEAFRKALRARKEDPANKDALALARYAVAKALRALGRAEEAVPLLEEAVAFADEAGAPDGWYEEELAESYAAAGRADAARMHAERALRLLADADPTFTEDAARRSRLRELAHSQTDWPTDA